MGTTRTKSRQSKILNQFRLSRKKKGARWPISSKCTTGLRPDRHFPDSRERRCRASLSFLFHEKNLPLIMGNAWVDHDFEVSGNGKATSLFYLFAW